MSAISRRLLFLATINRLTTITNATGYLGRAGIPLPGLEDTTPLDPPEKSADDRRVQPYFIVAPGAGVPSDEADVADTYDDLVWPFPITVAGGDPEDVYALVDRVDAALRRWAPTLNGVRVGPFQTPRDGYDAPMLTDRDVKPWRFFVALRYELTATT